MIDRIKFFFKLATSNKNSLSERSKKALSFKLYSANDFFGGWEVEDIDLLSKYKHETLHKPSAGQIIDWLGIKTFSKYHSWYQMPKKIGVLIADLPIPDDSLHAEAIEYVALINSIENAKMLNRKSYNLIELGASYGPWTIAGGILAERNGFKKINLTAVEASSSMHAKIKEHAKNNKLTGKKNVRLTIVKGAIAEKNGFVFFPKVNVSSDNGAQISNKIINIDYRGVKVKHEKIKSYNLATLTKEYDVIDFMHMDIQGAESTLLKNFHFKKVLNDKVNMFFLATQSRLIEGLAIEALSKLGWKLLRERPTIYKQNTLTKNINGWALRDGGQLWINQNRINKPNEKLNV